MITKTKQTLIGASAPLSGNTVKRFFPKPVRLTLDDHTQIAFKQGVNMVPEEYADHQWLKANGVEEVVQGEPLPPLSRPAPVGSQAFAASVAASGVMYSGVDAPRQHSDYNPVGEADRADGDVIAAEANLETLCERAESLRNVANKHLARQAEIDRQNGVEANTGEGADDGTESGMSANETTTDSVTKGGEARPVKGDTNPKTGNPFTDAALQKAQAAWDELPEDEAGDDNGED